MLTGHIPGIEPPHTAKYFQKRGENMRVTTQDLYCGAYILSKGGRLEEARLTSLGHRPSVNFTLSGECVDKLLQEFQSGQATINLASFKVAMTHLKDVMFACLRQEAVVAKTPCAGGR